MAIADAVRISMSIPLFFTAKKLNDCHYVDGGVLNNYPIKLFDRSRFVETAANGRDTVYYNQMNQVVKDGQFVYNQETLGFRLDSRQEITTVLGQTTPVRHSIDHFFDFAWALVETLMEAQQSQHIHEDDWHRTIYIDTLGVKTTEFNLSSEKKKALIASGRKGVLDYFKWFDSAAGAANKPAVEPAAKPRTGKRAMSPAN